MSKGFKKVLGVVAAIAIPIAAPAIASSIGLSSAIGTAVGSTTAGNILGGSLVGAGLGAIKGAALGEDIGRSALFGGIGGGVSGYFSAPTAAGASAGSQALGTGLTVNGSGGYGLTAGLQSGTGYGLSAGSQALGTGLSTGGFGMSASPQALGAGLSAGGFGDYSLTAGLSSGIGMSAGSQALGTGLSVGGFGAPAGSQALGTGLSGAAFGTTASNAAPTTFMEALKQVPSTIAAQFKDPKALADLTLRAAGQLAGSAVAGDGLSPEQRKLLDAQAAELQYLQQTNQELFRQRLEQAQALIGESRYFDPEYFGLQSARRAQLAGAAAKQVGLRGLTGDARRSEARRYDLANARNVGTAYDVGYNTGVQGRLNTMTAGINAMPQGYQTSFDYFTKLGGAYGDPAARRREKLEGIGTLFGSLTGR